MSGPQPEITRPQPAPAEHRDDLSAQLAQLQSRLASLDPSSAEYQQLLWEINQIMRQMAG